VKEIPSPDGKFSRFYGFKDGAWELGYPPADIMVTRTAVTEEEFLRYADGKHVWHLEEFIAAYDAEAPTIGGRSYGAPLDEAALRAEYAAGKFASPQDFGKSKFLQEQGSGSLAPRLKKPLDAERAVDSRTDARRALRGGDLGFKEYCAIVRAAHDRNEGDFEEEHALEKAALAYAQEKWPHLRATEAFVRKAFAGMKNKYGDPVENHSVDVAAIVARHGGTDEQVGLALLHDIDEDAPQAVREKFKTELRPDFAAKLAHLTEPRGEWKERKAAYLASLADAAPDVKLVSISDKIWFLRSFLDGYLQEGDKIWLSFHDNPEECKAGYRWFYTEFLKTATAGMGENPACRELRPLVHRLLEIAR